MHGDDAETDSDGLDGSMSDAWVSDDSNPEDANENTPEGGPRRSRVRGRLFQADQTGGSQEDDLATELDKSTEFDSSGNIFVKYIVTSAIVTLHMDVII